MREKCFRHAINTAVRNLKLYNNDPVLRFFKAFATLMEGRLKCDFIYILLKIKVPKTEGYNRKIVFGLKQILK